MKGSRNHGVFFSTFSAFLGRRLGVVLGSVFLCCLAAASLPAQEIFVTLDPAATKVDFALGATLHTVHGTFKLEDAQLHFDPATGKVSGSVTLDATSASTDNGSRDGKMHAEVLESAKFPEIVFAPADVKGTILLQGTSEVEISNRAV
jgi:polyisoprenoid-binding protein YceI